MQTLNLQFAVLGSIEARLDGRPVDLGHARQQCVLAVLLVDAGRPVPIGRIIERVWAGDPPERVQNALYSYVSRLRRALAGMPIHRRQGAYLLDAEPDSVDLHRFRRLVELARDPSAGDERRLALLEQALALWRGEPFAHLDSPWLDGLRVTLAAERMAAELDRDDLLLRAGQHADLLPSLTARVSAHPLNERLVGQLMLALHRSGRQADALELYQRTRRLLAEEIGSDPGEPLQRLHQQVLAGDEANVTVPRHLPPDIAAFVGRADELSTIDTAVDVCVITGMAGVGKTALAVQAAHRMTPRFPDGQLYVNLRGFDPSGAPKPPAEALRGFLEALGVAPHTAPESLEALTARFRSLLADRRVLVVLDNARDAEQVRPLLPASPGCLTLVTSRERLTGLVATEGARPIGLDVLSTVDAQDLLRKRLGAARIDRDPDATRELIARCAHLPLALAVVAARAAMHPEFPLQAVAEELRTLSSLDAFADPDPMADVRAAFSWSYRAVNPTAARLFRVLAAHPGPDITAAAAVSVLGTGEEPPLAELERAHLIAQHAPGRYSFHDLLRAHAAELTDDASAVDRAIDHYVHTGHRAALLLNPHRGPVDPPPASPGVTPEPLDGFPQALAWFDAEHVVMLACIDLAVAHGSDAKAWHLAWILSTFFGRRGHLHDWATTQATALGAAQRMGDAGRQAHAHRDLGRALARLGHSDEALANMSRAIDIYRELGDDAGRAHGHVNMGIIFERLGRYQEAIKHAYAGVELFRMTGNGVGQARTHNNIGWYHAHLGEYRQALEHCREALALQEALDDVSGQAASWDSLGYVHHHLGERDEAIACFRRAVELSGSIGDRHNVADILIHLGDAHASFGEPAQAGDAWERALDILETMRHPDAAKVRAKLVSLGKW